MEMPLEAAGTPRASRPVRGPHGGWQAQEIEALRESVEQAGQSGESLRSVFEKMGKTLGRRPNSIRNFYYAQLRAQEGEGAARSLPFETFAPDEVEALLERVLTARAKGMSVRACVRELAQGDRTKMLRYQNKYRSIIRTRPELVQRVMERLRERGVPFVSPYAEPGEEHPPLAPLREKAQGSGDAQLVQLFSALDHLLDLALAHTAPAAQENAPAQDGEALRRADRLSARCDVLRIALDDEQGRFRRLRGEAESMVTLLKEYIALPEADRMSHCGDFCQQAAARLSAVECAMMAGEAQ